MTEVLTCTHEGPQGQRCENPRADQRLAATNRHCKAHKAEAQKKYMDTKDEKDQAKGFVLGVEALRAVLVTEFDRLGAGNFSGDEVAHLIAGTPRPKFSEAQSQAA